MDELVEMCHLFIKIVKTDKGSCTAKNSFEAYFFFFFFLYFCFFFATEIYINESTNESFYLVHDSCFSL